MAIKTTQAILPQILRKGRVSHLAGISKDLKTYLTINIVKLLTTPEHSMGDLKYEGAPIRVLFMTDDLNYPNRLKLDKLGIRTGPSLDVVTTSNKSLIDHTYAAELLEQLKNFDVLVIDSVNSFMSPREHAFEYPLIFKTLHNLSRSSDVAVLVTEQIRCQKGFQHSSYSDAHLLLKRSGGHRFMLRFNNHQNKGSYRFNFDVHTGNFTANNHTVSKVVR